MTKDLPKKDGNDEKEIKEIERRLSEAKSSKRVEELEAELASLKKSDEKKSQVVVKKGKPMPRPLKIGIIAAFIFAAMVLIFSVAQDSETPQTTNVAIGNLPTEASGGEQAALSDGCFVAPQAMVDAIASGSPDESFLDVTRAAGWGQNDQGYFVAAEVKMPNGSLEQGVWASYDPLARGGTGLGLVLAVNGVAKKVTVYPDASGTKAAIQANDPGVGMALACLNK